MTHCALTDWRIAEALAEPQELFVLWAVKVLFCTRLEDFSYHFGNQLPINDLVQKLEVQKLLDRDGNKLVLTEAGEAAVSYLGDLQISEYAKPSRELEKVKDQFGLHHEKKTPPISDSRRSYLPSQEDLKQKKWHLIDAQGQHLGRLASEIAKILQGKNKPIYTPHLDTGDFVVVINAEKVEVTGKKRTQKVYRRHSGRPGGMKTESFKQLQARIPERIIEQAVKGMLPKNSLGRKSFRKLKVYAGSTHPHQAQKPEPYQVGRLSARYQQ